jgi:hypothetical protein
LGEYRSGTKSEFTLLHVKYGGTGDVRWHQVSGELNPTKLASQHTPERSHEQRFAQPGNRLDQHVSARKQRCQRSQHEFFLTDIQLGDFLRNLVVKALDRLEFGGCFRPSRRRRSRRRLINHPRNNGAFNGRRRRASWLR